MSDGENHVNVLEVCRRTQNFRNGTCRIQLDSVVIEEHSLNRGIMLERICERRPTLVFTFVVRKNKCLEAVILAQRKRDLNEPCGPDLIVC